MCSHREPPYANVGHRHDLWQSELAQDHSILLPIYAQMSEHDQDRVVDALRAELRQSIGLQPVFPSSNRETIGRHRSN
jgi:perosamine synthetase